MLYRIAVLKAYHKTFWYFLSSSLTEYLEVSAYEKPEHSENWQKTSSNYSQLIIDNSKRNLLLLRFLYRIMQKNLFLGFQIQKQMEIQVTWNIRTINHMNF